MLLKLLKECQGLAAARSPSYVVDGRTQPAWLVGIALALEHLSKLRKGLKCGELDLPKSRSDTQSTQRPFRPPYQPACRASSLRSHNRYNLAIKCSAAALWDDARYHSRELLSELRHVKGTKPAPRPPLATSGMADLPFPLGSASLSVCVLATSGATPAARCE